MGNFMKQIIYFIATHPCVMTYLKVPIDVAFNPLKVFICKSLMTLVLLLSNHFLP